MIAMKIFGTILRKTDNASARRPAAHRLRRSTSRRQAMTLIELLVSVAILSIMILMFSSILADSQKVVAVSQSTMHANSKAAAIAEIIRNDIRRITQNGFLCITQTSEANPADRTPLLLFTTAGVSPSATSADIATGFVVCYGISDNQATGATDKILWRQAWVLQKGGTGDDAWPDDEDSIDLHLRVPDKTPGRKTFIDDIIGKLQPSAAVITVPAAMGEVADLWQCLTRNCKDFSVTWTDGDDDKDLSVNDLGWYGIQREGTKYYKVKDLNDPPSFPEFVTAGDDRYYAVWTRHYQNTWPKAIRIRFVLTDDSVPEELRDTQLGETVYEVICPIGM